MTANQKLRLLMLSLAAGDSLGSTSEFCEQAEIPSVYRRHKAEGWPFKQVGQGAFNWKPGEPTDDSAMAMCIVRSFIDRGAFDPSDIATRFVAWLDSSPPDIGMATRRGLTAVKRGIPWHRGGIADFDRNKHSAANGSLMRNAPVAAMATSLGEAFEFSLKQSIITHYGPLPVACCCAQSFLIWQLLEGKNPFQGRWQDEFFDIFVQWLEICDDKTVKEWMSKTMSHQVQAWQTFHAADFDNSSFSPFGYDFNGSDGYCLLTLQIAAWAAEQSMKGKAVPTPSGFDSDPFVKAVGPAFGAAVVLVGHDSDTYGAAAFPLIAAAHGHVPPEMTAGLWVASELDELGLK